MFHSLRHTMATLLARANMHLSVAQKILRHANIETTLAIYRHVDGIEEMRAAVAKLDFGPLEEQAPFKAISKEPSTDDSEWMPLSGVRSQRTRWKPSCGRSLFQSISGVLANGFVQVIERLAGRQRNAAGQNHRVRRCRSLRVIW